MRIIKRVALPSVIFFGLLVSSVQAQTSYGAYGVPCDPTIQSCAYSPQNACEYAATLGGGGEFAFMGLIQLLWYLGIFL